jgi:hypothetical protein
MKTRRQFIKDVVENYIENHREEYDKFLRMMEWKRANLADKKHAELDVKEIRCAFSIPDGLYNTLRYVLNGYDEPKLGGVKGEMKWFVKKFPQFLLPLKY